MTHAFASCDGMPVRLVVLISGTGSNLQAIFRAIDAGTCGVNVAAVISDRAEAPGLDHARRRGVPTEVVSMKVYANRAAWDEGLAKVVASHTPDVVVLAGFMRILGAPLLALFPFRIVNVHPALCPAFPGADAPAQAIAARVRISGCTVHLVDSGVDTGPILAQAAVPVAIDDTAATLHARIQIYEHRLLPEVLDAIARGVITLGPVPTVEACIAPDAALVSPILSAAP